MGAAYAKLVRWVARRPAAVVGAVVALALGGALLAAFTLHPTAGTDSLIGRGTATFQATDRLHRAFGDDPVYVLVREPVKDIVLTSDLERVLGLEGCLSGNAPPGDRQIPGGPKGPCAALARTKPVKVVYGPGTFLNDAVSQIDDQFNAEKTAKGRQAAQACTAAYQLARARHWSVARSRNACAQAEQLVYAEFTREALSLALQYGLSSLPSLNDPSFISRVVFSDTASGCPKQRFAYLFPTCNSALIQVRFKPSLSDAQRDRAISLVRQAVDLRDRSGKPFWRLPNGHGSYLVTGAPVVASALAARLSRALVVLLIAALLIMAATLALVLRSRLRLLPLGIALLATALTFGALAVVGAPLTMATIGVLPVLIGLAVDYAIQFQSRVAEHGGDVERAAAAGVPTIATAGAATAAGFLVVALSPVPMVRDFGLLLVLGVVLALGCALTAGTGVLVLAGRSPRRRRRPGPIVGALGAAARGAEELVRENRAARTARRGAQRASTRVLALATRDPRRVLIVGAVLAVAGWAVGTQASVQTDVNRLMPQDVPALHDLRTLERVTGVGGEIDVTVQGADITQPRVVAWMERYQQRLLRRYGYRAGHGCGRATLCPAFSLPDLLSGSGAKLTQGQIRSLLDAVPPYFSEAVITADRRMATLAFGIRLMPLSRQERVVADMRNSLDPPRGVSAELAGLPVVAADASAKVSSGWRRALTLIAGLLAVALVLMLALRTARRALVPLVPIAMATGWSSLVLGALQIALNPMSITLGVLVIAISTEFSVLLSERYRQERRSGFGRAQALERTYRSTGAAVLASGTTAIAGFAVLAVSDVPMLRDFGWVTVIDLTVSLLGVLIVLPAALVAAERGGLRATGVPLDLRRLRPRRPRATAAAGAESGGPAGLAG